MRALAAVLALLVAGCAPGGFVRPDPTIVQLGRTTYGEVVARMGQPAGETNFERNGEQLTAVSYVYASEAEKNHGDHGVIAGRTLNFFFHGERLVGHEFSSTVAKDHTDFDLRKMRTIEKGKTTRDQVLQLLGQPSGYIAYPVVKTPNPVAVYTYRESRRMPFAAPKIYSKTLLLFFDDAGVVHDVVFNQQGSR